MTETGGRKTGELPTSNVQLSTSKAQAAICLKELRESYRWLRLIQHVPLLKPSLVEPLANETDELIRIFLRSIKTASSKRK